MGKAVFESDQQEEEAYTYRLYRDGDQMWAQSSGYGPVMLRELLPKKALARMGWNNSLLVPLNPSVEVQVSTDQKDVAEGYVRVINQGTVQIYSISHFRLTTNDESRI